MLTRRRGWAAGSAAAAAVLGTLTAPAAYADDPGRFWGTTECGVNGCRVSAHSSGTRAGASASAPTQGRGAQRAAAEPDPSCVRPDEEFARSGLEGPVPPPGRVECTAAAGSAAEGEPAVDLVVLAERARERMEVPVPRIGAAPPLDGRRYVRMPQWMWVDGSDWEPVSATASVSSGSVTVTAVPARVVWDMGDGHQVVCRAPGTVYTQESYTPEGSPDCGHTYTRVSAGEPGGVFGLEAVWEWDVSWSAGTGEGGDLAPLVTTAAEQVVVSELQVLVTGAG